MEGRLETIQNEHLGRPGCLWSYGVFGPPVLVFPSAAGMAHEWAAHSMIEAHGPRLAAGRLKLYCIESNVSQSWTNKEATAAEKLERHRAYERFILESVVPYIYADCQTEGIPITTIGISVGAYLAVNFALKHPTVFRHAIGLSGRYDVAYFTKGDSAPGLYFENPLAYVRGLKGEALARVNDHTRITLVCGQGNWEDGNFEETVELGRLLKAQGVPCDVDLRGRDTHHQWPFWKQQSLEHFARLFD